MDGRPCVLLQLLLLGLLQPCVHVHVLCTIQVLVYLPVASAAAVACLWLVVLLPPPSGYVPVFNSITTSISNAFGSSPQLAA